MAIRSNGFICSEAATAGAQLHAVWANFHYLLIYFEYEFFKAAGCLPCEPLSKFTSPLLGKSKKATYY